MRTVSLLSASLLLCSAPSFAQAPDTTSRPAQTPDSNSQSNETTRAGNANANANKTTMTGCISERNGKYILTTNSMASNQSTGQSSTTQSPSESTSSQPPTSQSSQSGTQSGQTSAQSTEQSGTQPRTPQGIELMTTQDLKSHIGHTVRVTGTMTYVATGSSTTTTTPDRNSDSSQNTATTGNSSKMNRTMKVSDIQMVSETCEMKGSATPQQH
jgi:hypothetical protein